MIHCDMPARLTKLTGHLEIRARRSLQPLQKRGNGTERPEGCLPGDGASPGVAWTSRRLSVLSPDMPLQYQTIVHGVTRNQQGTEASFTESTTVRLVSDQEAFLVLQNVPLPGSTLLLDTTLLDEGDHLVQARIRGQVISREGVEWRLSISPRSRLYSVPRSNHLNVAQG